MKKLFLVLAMLLFSATCYGWSDNDYPDEHKAAVEDVIANDADGNGIPDTTDAGGGGLTDAPSDGTEYLRKDGDWVNPTSTGGTTEVADQVTITGTGTLADPFVAVGGGAESDPVFSQWLLSFTPYSDADIDGNEDAFSGWDKDSSDDFTWDYDYTDLINKPSIPSTASEMSYTNTTSGMTATDTQAAIDEIEGRVDTNDAKVSNVPTALSIGTKTATTVAITSDGGADDVVLPEADTDNAGLIGADKWDEIVANTSARHADESDASTTVKGIIEIADDTEALAGTDTGKAVTPAGVKIYGDSVYEPKDTNILKSTEQNAGTDITADLEEESHASEHAVSAADTVFPADPNADRYLMWDDDPGALVWASVAGAAHDAVTLGTFADKFLSLTSQQLDLELTDPNADRAVIWDDDPGAFAWLDYSSFLTSIPDNYLLNTGDAGTGTYDFGAADDFEVPNGTNPTVDTAGQIAVDSSAAPGSGIRFYGDAAYTIAGTYSKSFVILNPVATDDYPIWCTPYAITIKRVRVQCLGGTNIVGQLTECDGEGINAAVVDDSDITATANNSVDDDGTLSNPSIDANDYVGWKTESISGTPTSVTVTFDYIINAVN